METDIDGQPIPEETKIYFSRMSILIGVIGVLGVFILGLYIALGTLQYIGGSIVCAFAIFLSYFVIKRSKNREPQIIINKLGIKTATAEFYPWDEIGNEIVTTEMRDKAEHICLEYDCPGGHEEVEISDLAINGDELALLLVVYRKRSGKKYKYDQNYLGLNKPGDN